MFKSMLERILVYVFSFSTELRIVFVIFIIDSQKTSDWYHSNYYSMIGDKKIKDPKGPLLCSKTIIS